MAKADTMVSMADTLTDAIKAVGNSGNVVEDLFDKAHALSEAKEKLFEQRVAVRESLRNLDTAGILNEDQSAELAELYPPRRRGENGDEDEPEV